MLKIWEKGSFRFRGRLATYMPDLAEVVFEIMLRDVREGEGIYVAEMVRRIGENPKAFDLSTGPYARWMRVVRLLADPIEQAGVLLAEVPGVNPKTIRWTRGIMNDNVGFDYANMRKLGRWARGDTIPPGALQLPAGEPLGLGTAEAARLATQKHFTTGEVPPGMVAPGYVTPERLLQPVYAPPAAAIPPDLQQKLDATEERLKAAEKRVKLLSGWLEYDDSKPVTVFKFIMDYRMRIDHLDQQIRAMTGEFYTSIYAADRQLSEEDHERRMEAFAIEDEKNLR